MLQSFNDIADRVRAGASNIRGHALSILSLALVNRKGDVILDVSQMSSLAEISAALGLARTGVKTSAYTAKAWELVPTNATSASVAISLPPTPKDGTEVVVKMLATTGSNVTTISTTDGSTLNKTGGGTTLTLSVENQAARLSYNAAGAIWTIVSGDIPLAQLDRRFVPATVAFRKTYAKLATMSDNVAARLTWVVGGDSLGPLIPRYIVALLRETYRNAGGVGYFGPGGGTFNYSGLVGTAVYASSDDFTVSPNGRYVTLAASGDGALIEFIGNGAGGNATGYVFPLTALTTPIVDTIKVYYLKEPGAGTFKVQTSPDGSNWTDVTGLTAVSAANGTKALGIATATITALEAKSIRVMWVSGTVRVFAGGAINSAGSGIVVYDLATGGMDIGTFANSALAAPFIADIPADVTSIALLDGAVGDSTTVGTNLDLWNGLFTTSPDKLYIGATNVSGTTLQQTLDYNATIRGRATAHGAYYFDPLTYQGSYAIASALGNMTDGTHPNNRFNSYAATALWRDLGLESVYQRPKPIAGVGSAFFRPGGLVFSKINQSGDYNSGTSETDVVTWDLGTAGILRSNGDRVHIHAEIGCAQDSNTAKRIRVYFGANKIWDSGDSSADAGGWLNLDTWITKYSPTQQRSTVQWQSGITFPSISTATNWQSTQTPAGGLVFRITFQGTGTAKIFLYSTLGLYYPAI